MVSSAYLRLLIFLLTILIPACASSSPAFHMMCSAYKLNKQGDIYTQVYTQVTGYTALMYAFPNLKPVHCSMSGSNGCFLTCIQISQEVGRVVFHSYLFKNFAQFLVIHTVKDFSVVNEAEFACVLYDPMDVANLISGSSVFPQLSLYIWKFMVHVLQKPSLKDFEHNLANMWNEHNCTVVWIFFDIHFFGIRMKTDLFQFCGHCWVFWICWHTVCNTLIALYFRIWNNSAIISLPPLAL